MVRTEWMAAARKMAMTKGMLVLLVALALSMTLSGCGAEAEQEEYAVTRVVDGDTIIVNINGKDERLRFIGVDTPESVHPDKSKNVPYGQVASDFTKAQLEGKSVTLEFDAQERDRYGRLLAYVYVDGKMFNETLLEEGHAKVATFPPNVKYVEGFTVRQREAREGQKGLWAEGLFLADEAEPRGELPEKTQGSSAASAQEASTGGSPGSADKGQEVSTERALNTGHKEQQEFTYIGNVNTKKYHKSSCRYVSQIKEGYGIPLEPADLEDYVACKVCLP